jgi:hypothetical protein
MADCASCHGFGQWWEWKTSRGVSRKSFTRSPPRDLPAWAAHVICPDCQAGGTQHCCDGLQAQPESALYPTAARAR